MSLEVYWGSGSPYAWRVLLALEIKRTPYVSRLIEFSKKQHKAPEFLALNPNGLVPVIVDGGFVLWESHAILRYLNEAHGGLLVPGDRRGRAVADQWFTWQATELNPAWSYAFLALARRVPGYDDPDRIAGSVERWTALMTLLDSRLEKTGAYAGGAEFTLADIEGETIHRQDRAEAAGDIHESDGGRDGAALRKRPGFRLRDRSCRVHYLPRIAM